MQKHREDFENDARSKRLTQLMTEHLNESKLLVFRWKERVEELQLWIDLVEKFDNPPLCIYEIDNLTEEQRINFADAISKTSIEINKELGYEGYAS